MRAAADRALVRPRRRAVAALVALLLPALAGMAALVAVRPPAARGADAPAGAFSAARAFEQVRTIAAETHVAGSPANDRVREHLSTVLRGLGLDPQVQDTVSVQGAELSASAGGTGLARVRNLVAVIPGTASTGRVFLVAHYDSVQTGPGANDDGAGTSTLLETARALTTGPRLRNDVVLVFTDAEEACLCGAKAFVDQHPLARDAGGVVLNVEARGSTGPAIMFETSRDNAGLVGTYAEVPAPVGTSFAVEVYRLLPNDTDFTPFREAGFAGLNTAYIDGSAVYHAPTDIPSAMNTRSLQHHGDNLLALTRAFGARDLDGVRAGGDATYFPVLGGLVHYPGWLTWPLAALAAAAVLALAWTVRRRGLAGGRRQAGAFALALLPLLAAPLLAQALWWLLKIVRPGYAQLPIDPYRPLWYRLAVLALTAFVLVTWYALLRRRLSPAALAVGGLGWLAVLGLVLAAVTPGGSYLAALPALAGALAGLAAVTLRGGWGAVVAVAVSGAVATAVLLPTVWMLFPALGMNLAGAGAFLAAMLGLALLPGVDLLHPAAGGQRGMAALRARRAGGLPALVAALTAAGCVAAGLTVDRFDAARPELTHLMYALDADTGTARWLSGERTPNRWTAQYVGGTPRKVDDTLPAFGDEEVLTGDATAATLPAPQLTVLSDTRAGDVRTLRVRLTPQRPVRMVGLHVAADTPVTAATVGGREVPVERAGDGPWGFGFLFHAPPAGGVEAVLSVRTGGPVRLRVMDGSDGLDALPGFRARPAGVGVVGSHTSELVAVARTYPV